MHICLLNRTVYWSIGRLQESWDVIVMRTRILVQFGEISSEAFGNGVFGVDGKCVCLRGC